MSNREKIIQRLREAPEQLRRKSMPLSDFIPLLQEAADALAQAEQRQEPVAIVDSRLNGGIGWGTPGGSTAPLPDGTLLYTSPQPREWVSLTEQEIVRCIVAAGCIGTVKMIYESGPYQIDRPSINASRFYDAIESLLREKNGGNV